MKKYLLLFLLLLIFSITKAQTVLIDPAGAGGFELGGTFAANGWTVVNGATNQWFVGNVAPPSSGTNCAYISNDVGGATYNYLVTSASTVHFYRDVTFPASQTDIQLSYKWKCQGESIYDYIAVYVISTGQTPTVNNPAGAGSSWLNIPVSYPGATVLNNPPQNLQGTFQTTNICLPAGFAGTTQRLVFMFSNDPSVGTQPPASIDEISLLSAPPSVPPTNQPTGLSLTPISTSQINGSFTAAIGNPTSYLVVRYLAGATPTAPTNGATYSAGQALGSGTVVKAGAGTTFSATGLSANTSYDFYVYSYNAGPCSNGNLYLAPSPLFGNASTLACSGISGVKTVGPTGDYPSLTAAMSVVNLGITGLVTLELQSTYTSGVETFPITFPSNACIGPINSLIIRPQLGATGLQILGTNTTAIFNFNGATYITIDGRPGGVGGFVSGTNLVIRNTAVGPTLRFINDAQFNIVKFCDVQGQNTTLTTATSQGGVICFGTTTGFNGNDNNIIDFCDIHETPTGTPVMGVFSYGTQTTVAQNNDNNVISNCNIYNVFSATVADAFIKVDLGNSAWTINNNKFYQTIPRTYTAAFIHRVLWITPNVGALTSASGFVITDNFIGGTNPAGSGVYTITGAVGYSFNGMDISVGLGAATSIQNNIVRNISMTVSNAAVTDFVGIGIANGNVNCGTVTGNVIGSSTVNGAISFTTNTTLGGLMGFRVGSGSIINLSNNTVGGIDLNGSTVSIAPSFSGIAVAGGTTITVQNNLIGSGTVANSINVVTAYTAASAAAVNGINVTAGTTTNILNNTIANINTNQLATGTQAASLRGIIVGTTTIPTITGNIIKNLSSSGQLTGTGANCTIVGISVSATSGLNTISNNTIKSLQLTHPTNNSAIQITGLFISNYASGLNTISRNLIHSFGISSPTNTAAVITGIDVGGGTSNYFNNMINLGTDSNGNSVTQPVLFRGITKGTTANNNYYFNSVYIGGTNVAAGAATQSTFAFVRGAIGTDQVRNNIFENNRSSLTTGGTMKHYAIRLTGGAGSLTINNNNYYTNGNDGILGSISGTDYPSFAGFQAATAQDAASINEIANFMNANGNAANKNMHIDFTIPSNVDNGGVNIAGITNDYDLDIRQGNAGYLGTGTAPDLGADEFELVLPPCAAANGGTITPNNQIKCALQAVTMTDVGATAGAGISRQWKVSTTLGGPYSNVIGGTGANTLSYTSGPLTAGTFYYVLETTCANGPVIGLSNEVTVLVNALPNVNINPNSGIICSPGGAAIPLTASGASTYTWNPTMGLTPTAGANVSANPTSTTNYIVTGTDGNGCSATSSAVISVGNNPTVNTISATPNSVCAGSITSLTAGATFIGPGTGPGPYNLSNIPFAPVSPSGPTSPGPVGDDIVGAAPIGFTFTFFGNNYTTAYISTNGFLSFDAGAGAGYPAGIAMPTAGIPNNVVTCAWADLNTAGGGTIEYFNLTSPNRFVVRYNGVAQYSVGLPKQVNGQIILYQTGEIEIHNTLVDLTNAVTIGVENSSGTVSTTVPGYNATTAPPVMNNQAFRFQQFVVTPVPNYLWSPAITGNIANPTQQTTNASPTASTTYTVTASTAIGCTATSTVTVNMLPVVTGSASVSPTPICLGDGATFTGSVPTSCPGGNVTGFAGGYAPANWTLTQTNSNGTVNTGGAPGSIIMTNGINGVGNGSTNYTINIGCAGTLSFNWSYSHPDAFGSVFDHPRYTINGGAPVLFPGFTTGGGNSQSGSASIPVNAGDFFQFQAFTSDNDPTPASTTISNFSAPTPPVGGTVSYWDASIGGTNLGAPPITVTPGAAGTITYYAEYTALGSGCVNPVRDPVTLTINGLPTVSASASPTTVCAGDASTLTGSGATSYTWNPGALTGSPTVNPLNTTTYTVTGTDGNSCSNTNTVEVTVNQLPTFTTVTPTDVLCNGSSNGQIIVSSGAAAAVYGINPVATQSPPGTFTGLAPNTYTITLADGNSCSSTTSVLISEPTVLSASASSGVISCNAGNTTLTGSGGGGTGPYTYQWIDGNTPGTITINPAKDNTIFEANMSNSNGAGPYFVAGTNGSGFKHRALLNFDIAANVPAGASITGVNLQLNCSQANPGSGAQSQSLHSLLEDWGEGTSVSFQAGQGTAATTNDATWINTFFPTDNWSALGGTYNGTASSTTIVNMVGLYNWTSAQMAADAQNWLNNPGGNFGWLLRGIETGPTQAKRFDSRENGNAANRPQLTINYAVPNVIGNTNTLNNATAGTYTLVVTDGNGCTSSSVITVTQPGPVPVTASATPNTTCNNTSVTPAGGGAVSYTWTAPLVDGMPFVATATNTYTVTGTDGSGCTGTSSVTVTVNPSSGILAPVTSNQSQSHGDDFDIDYYDASCDLIATVDDGAGGNVLGLTTSTVNVDPTANFHNGQPFVRRWYQITPASNGSADVVIYINQTDFDDYNSVVLPPYLMLPTSGNNGDPNIANIRITKNDDAGLGNNPIVITPAVNWNGNYWELSFNTPSFSQFRVHSVNPGNIPLPVVLTNFDGKKLESTDELTWTTGSEQNNAYFNLQHSTDGVNFATIAKVNSKAINGNSATPLNYNAINGHPVLGHNYYRLQQVDIDNKSSIHAKIVDLIWGANGTTVNIYPNPTRDILNIDLYTTKVQNTTVKVLDMSGRTIKQVQAKSVAGMNNITISLGEFASGLYTVQVYENDKLMQTGKVRKND